MYKVVIQRTLPGKISKQSDTGQTNFSRICQPPDAEVLFTVSTRVKKTIGTKRYLLEPFYLVLITHWQRTVPCRLSEKRGRPKVENDTK